jgi:hypothetical protein
MTVDASRFEGAVTASGTEADAARRLALLDGALELWRGRPLGEFEGTAWADREATWLEALRLEALQRRCDALIDLGRAGEAAAQLEGLVRIHPLDERFWALLMLALYRSAGRPMPSGPTSRPGTSSSRGWASNPARSSSTSSTAYSPTIRPSVLSLSPLRLRPLPTLAQIKSRARSSPSSSRTSRGARACGPTAPMRCRVRSSTTTPFSTRRWRDTAAGW